ncbi:MAG: phosphoglucomutase/phosphomannomutase family protein [Flavobacteriales bacterium]
MADIKFGTDGWRAVIAKDFTVENVARVAKATAEWLKTQEISSSVVIGHDCRFGGELFAETTAKVLLHSNITVYLAKGFVTTPMVSAGVIENHASAGIVITASHNPPEYNGFKLKGDFGGPLMPDKVAEVESKIPESLDIDLDNIKLEDYEQKGKLVYKDLEKEYIRRIENNFDLDAIRNSNLHLAYDAMYGTGQNVLQHLFPKITFLHCENNPSFHGLSPEPIHKNLKEFSELIAKSDSIDCGLATDGDADRIGLYNSKGEFIDSHHIILLLIHYLVQYKSMSGKVVTAFSTTERIKKICEYYDLDLEVVKIGFKHVCNIMIKENVLLGGEESGGIAIKGHVPERDGIWMGLVIWEFMAKSGKSLDDLIKEVYEIVGEFAFERSDLHIDENLKQSIMKKCENNEFNEFGGRKIVKTETLDGFKFYFNENEWVMIRPSGTEPVLRTYAESSSRDEAFKILEDCRKTILDN